MCVTRQAKKLRKGGGDPAVAPLAVETEAEEEAELSRMRAAGFATGGADAGAAIYLAPTDHVCT